MTHQYKALSRFITAEDGSASWFSIVPLIFVLIILGLGLDVTNATQERTHLQVTADAAAHAALVTRNRKDDTTDDYFTEAQSKAKGIELATLNMPVSQNGNVLNASNIVFGNWNTTTRTFTPSAGSQDAVQVITQQVGSNGNPVSTYLLRLIGFNTWDVRALTTMATFTDQCNKKDFGFFADGIVDLQSQSEYTDCFCIHSNTHVEIQPGNILQSCTSVTMPNMDDLVVPAGDKTKVDGLTEALGSDAYTIQEVEDLEATIDALNNDPPAYDVGYSPEFLAGISGINTVDFSKGNKDKDGNTELGSFNLVSTKVNRVICGNNGKVSIANDELLENMVIITECKVSFGKGSGLVNSLLATYSEDANSVTAPNGLQIGGHECTDPPTPGGNASILTLGGVSLASDVAFMSGQIIARGDVSMAAGDISVEGGAAVYSGGRIDATSNLVMEKICDDGSESNFTKVYFRYVE